jgi:hypothetical protein
MNEIAITQSQFLEALPPKLRKGVHQSTIDQITKTLSEPDTFELMRDNLLGYTNVMQQGKFSVETYVDAVKYVSFKLMGDTNLNAYMKTHPDRHARMVAKGMPPKDIASMVTAYNKTKIVNLIYEQTLIPTWVLNADFYQKAINVQAGLMVDVDVSPKVRTDAANSLLTHLKRPETSKIQLDITTREDSALSELRASTRELVEMQKKMIAGKDMTAQEVAHSNLVVEAEFVEV